MSPTKLTKYFSCTQFQFFRHVREEDGTEIFDNHCGIAVQARWDGAEKWNKIVIVRCWVFTACAHARVCLWFPMAHMTALRYCTLGLEISIPVSVARIMYYKSLPVANASSIFRILVNCELTTSSSWPAKPARLKHKQEQQQELQIQDTTGEAFGKHRKMTDES